MHTVVTTVTRWSETLQHFIAKYTDPSFDDLEGVGKTPNEALQNLETKFRIRYEQQERQKDGL